MSAEARPPDAEPGPAIEERLDGRPSRPPDHTRENQALISLAGALAAAPELFLQTLADAARHLCGADSAGVTLPERDGGARRLRWHAPSGVLANRPGYTLPPDFSLSGVVLARNTPLLVADPARRYTYLADLDVPIREALMVPLRREGVAVGTLWVVAHTNPRQFDAEDLRRLSSLAHFFSAATGLVVPLAGPVHPADPVQVSEPARPETRVERRPPPVERRRSERRWQQSEERLRLATDAADVGTWDFDPGSGALIWDAGVKRHFGLAPDAEIRGYEMFLEGLHPADRSRVDEAVQRALQPDSPGFDITYRTIGVTDHRERWIAAKGRALFDDAGQVVRFIGTTMDITAQESAAGQLQLLDALATATAGAGTATEVMAITTRMLGERLQVTRCAYADVEAGGDEFTIRHDWSPDSPSTVGTYSLAAFGSRAVSDLRAGRPLVLSDVEADLTEQGARAAFGALGIRAIVCCPLVKTGGLAALLAVHSARPRTWSAAEIALVREVTERSWAHIERARAEADLRESEEFLRQLVESSPDCITVLDLNAGLLSMNAYGMKQLEIEDFEAVRSRDWREFWTGNDRQAAQHALDQAVLGGVGRFEGYCPTWTGLPRWWSVVVTPLNSPGGAAGRLLAVSRDITEGHRAALGARFLAEASATLSELMDYESTLHRIANLAVESFADWCVVDVIDVGQRRRLDVSKTEVAQVRDARALDRSYPPLEEDLYGVSQVIRTGNPELVASVSDELLQQQSQSADHLERLRGRGVQSYICVPLQVRGQAIGAMTFFVTGTSRRYTQVELDVASDLARRVSVAIDNSRLYRSVQESDQRKGEFLATLAHELRNPLAPIRTGLEVLRRSGPQAEGEARAREMMDRQLSHMVRLIDDLLDVSRLSRGRLELKNETLDLVQVVRDAVEGSQPLIDAAQHRLTVSLPEGPVRLHGDPTRLSQIFANLLTNAAKYTPDGGTIALSAVVEGTDVVVSVSDSGVGIAPDQLPEIFEMFTQVGQHLDRSQGGLGIGLTLVKRLTEMHGGTVIAASGGLNRGSTFRVRLPIMYERPRTDHAPPQVARAQPAGARLLKVLVVDDNADNAEMLSMLIGTHGHEVRAAFTGPDALRVAESFEPDVVFLDIGLPGMTGYEVAERLRTRPALAQALLVALTGWGAEEHVLRSKAAGFDVHLTKPVDPADVDRLLLSKSVKPPADEGLR